MNSRGRRWLLWVLALALITAFSSLGAWQWRRSGEKREMLERAEHALRARAAQPAAVAWDATRARDYDRVEIRGGFAPRPPLLLDNQLRNGKAGVRVYRVFYPQESGRELLVDMGWLPLNGRRELPARERLAAPIRVGGAPVMLRGLLAPPPSSGLALGRATDYQPDRHLVLMPRFDLGAIDAEVGQPGLTMAPRVLKLDPTLPFGYARDLDVLPNTLPPERHLGYAVQWFALAATVLITALLLSLRKSRSRISPVRTP